MIPEKNFFSSVNWYLRRYEQKTIFQMISQKTSTYGHKNQFFAKWSKIKSFSSNVAICGDIDKNQFSHLQKRNFSRWSQRSSFSRKVDIYADMDKKQFVEWFQKNLPSPWNVDIFGHISQKQFFQRYLKINLIFLEKLILRRYMID